MQNKMEVFFSKMEKVAFILLNDKEYFYDVNSLDCENILDWFTHMDERTVQWQKFITNLPDLSNYYDDYKEVENQEATEFIYEFTGDKENFELFINHLKNNCLDGESLYKFTDLESKSEDMKDILGEKYYIIAESFYVSICDLEYYGLNPKTARLLDLVNKTEPFIEERKQRAIHNHKIAAEYGNAESQFELYQILEQDEAIKYVKLAAEQGHTKAEASLGSAYQGGCIVSKDYKKSIYWLKKAAKKGNERAELCLANAYRYGYGVRKRPKKSFHYYKKATEYGNKEALEEVAKCYATGIGTKKNYDIAFDIYKKLALKYEEPKYQYCVGRYCLLGVGVPQRAEMAIFWFKKAALQNYPDAVYTLGLCYEFGFGFSKDFDEAISLYQKADKMGSKLARKTLKNIHILKRAI